MINEEELMLRQAEAQISAAESANNFQQTQTAAQSSILEEQEKSMVLDQLDLSDELERIEHLLRGHIIKEGEWDTTIDLECPPTLNEYGVRLIMKLISFYLNKNTLLSNYTEKLVNSKMEDFSLELADLIFMKYKEMGFDTPDKRKMYSVLVREIQDSVHSTYLRALSGKERESLRKHWNITENMGGNNQNTTRRNGSMGFLRRN